MCVAFLLKIHETVSSIIFEAASAQSRAQHLTKSGGADPVLPHDPTFTSNCSRQQRRFSGTLIDTDVPLAGLISSQAHCILNVSISVPCLYVHTAPPRILLPLSRWMRPIRKATCLKVHPAKRICASYIIHEVNTDLALRAPISTYCKMFLFLFSDHLKALGALLLKCTG